RTASYNPQPRFRSSLKDLRFSINNTSTSIFDYLDRVKRKTTTTRAPDKTKRRVNRKAPNVTSTIQIDNEMSTPFFFDLVGYVNTRSKRVDDQPRSSVEIPDLVDSFNDSHLGTSTPSFHRRCG